MGTEIVTLSEVRQTDRQTSYDITYMLNLEKDTDELISNTERNPQTQKTNLGLPEGKAGRRGGIT